MIGAGVSASGTVTYMPRPFWLPRMRSATVLLMMGDCLATELATVISAVIRVTVIAVVGVTIPRDVRTIHLR